MPTDAAVGVEQPADGGQQSLDDGYRSNRAEPPVRTGTARPCTHRRKLRTTGRCGPCAAFFGAIRRGGVGEIAHAGQAAPPAAEIATMRHSIAGAAPVMAMSLLPRELQLSLQKPSPRTVPSAHPVSRPTEQAMAGGPLPPAQRSLALEPLTVPRFKAHRPWVLPAVAVVAGARGAGACDYGRKRSRQRHKVRPFQADRAQAAQSRRNCSGWSKHARCGAFVAGDDGNLGANRSGAGCRHHHAPGCQGHGN